MCAEDLSSIHVRYRNKILFYWNFPVDGLRNSCSCILPEFCSPSTGKTALEKNRPYTVWTATLRSICWNYSVNLKQCIFKITVSSVSENIHITVYKHPVRGYIIAHVCGRTACSYAKAVPVLSKLDDQYKQKTYEFAVLFQCEIFRLLKNFQILFKLRACPTVL